jgi:hypothetical protein
MKAHGQGRKDGQGSGRSRAGRAGHLGKVKQLCYSAKGDGDGGCE